MARIAGSPGLPSLKSCKLCTLFHTPSSAVQRRDEVPQLDRRKFPEAILDLALGPLQEDPARGAAALTAYEVHTPSHRASPDLRVWLHLDVDVPALIAALQLAHVLGALLAGEGGAHAERLRCLGDSCQLDSGLDDLSRVRNPSRGHGEVLSQMRGSGGRRPGGVAGGAAVGGGWSGSRRARCRARARHRGLLGKRDAGCGSGGGWAASRIPHRASRYFPDVPRGAR